MKEDKLMIKVAGRLQLQLGRVIEDCALPYRPDNLRVISGSCFWCRPQCTILSRSDS